MMFVSDGEQPFVEIAKTVIRVWHKPLTTNVPILLFMFNDLLHCIMFCALLLHDAMHECCLCCCPVSISLSIRPSVMLVHCIQMAEDIVKLLSLLDSPIHHSSF